jgi:hypothetical protein
LQGGEYKKNHGKKQPNKIFPYNNFAVQKISITFAGKLTT